MTRRSGDTKRRPRLNLNAQNIFYMRVESIVILSSFFVAGMSRDQANEDSLEIKEVECRASSRMDKWMDGCITGKITDSSLKLKKVPRLKMEGVY